MTTLATTDLAPAAMLPTPRRLRTYLDERYPTGPALVISVCLGLACSTYGQADMLASGAPLAIDATALGGCALVYLFLLVLRIYDEHKDAELDAATRPDRPVPRGLVSLPQLRRLGALALGAQLGLAFLPGWRAGALYLVPVAYSLAMLVEFGAHRWLGERLLAYAASHMLVMPMLALALAGRVGATERAWPLEAALGATLVFTGFFALEVMRKLRTPDAELRGVDTYSSRLGLSRAATLASALVVATASLAAALGWLLGGDLVWLAVISATAGAVLVALWRFSRRPTATAEARLQPLAGLLLIIALAGPVVLAALAHGATARVVGLSLGS